MEPTLRTLCLAIAPLLFPFHAGGDGLQRSEPQPILKYLSTRTVLDAVENVTGYQIKIIGDIPESKVTEAPNDIVLPQDIDRLARSLGIDSYAATIDSETLTIRLLVLRSTPEKGESDLGYLSLGIEQGPADRLSSQDPYLTSTEQQMVVSFYETQQISTPHINIKITQDDKNKAEGEIPPDEPYLTAADEKSLVLFYKQLQSDIYEIDTLITSDNNLGLTESNRD